MKHNYITSFFLSSFLLTTNVTAAGELSRALNGIDVPGENKEEWRAGMKLKFKARTEVRLQMLERAKQAGANEAVCRFLEARAKKAATSQALFEEGRKPEVPAGKCANLLRKLEQHGEVISELRSHCEMQTNISDTSEEMKSYKYLLIKKEKDKEVLLENIKKRDEVNAERERLEKELSDIKRKLKGIKTEYAERSGRNAALREVLDNLNQQAEGLRKEITTLTDLEKAEPDRHESELYLEFSYNWFLLTEYKESLDPTTVPEKDRAIYTRIKTAKVINVVYFSKEHIQRSITSLHEATQQPYDRILRCKTLERLTTSLREIEKSIQTFSQKLKPVEPLELPVDMQKRKVEISAQLAHLAINLSKLNGLCSESVERLEEDIQTVKQVLKRQEEALEEYRRQDEQMTSADILAKRKVIAAWKESHEYKVLEEELYSSIYCKLITYINLSKALTTVEHDEDLTDYLEQKVRKWFGYVVPELSKWKHHSHPQDFSLRELYKSMPSDVRNHPLSDETREASWKVFQLALANANLMNLNQYFPRPSLTPESYEEILFEILDNVIATQTVYPTKHEELQKAVLQEPFISAPHYGQVMKLNALELAKHLSDSEGGRQFIKDLALDAYMFKDYPVELNDTK